MTRVLLAVMLFAVSHCLYAGGVDIHDVTIWQQNNDYLLDANLEYNLSDEVFDALDNGIPLVFRVSIEVEEQGWLGSNLEEIKIDYQVRYRLLSSLYEVTTSLAEGKHSFVSRSALFAYLGELRQVRLISRDQLTQDVGYQVAIRAGLQISALPLPMRLMALLSTDWNLSSEWKTWQLQK